MRQALHIFKKDVRCLLYEISATLALVALFTINGHAGPRIGLELALLPIAWWVLVIRVIHEERIPGDRQFWLTRPYEWKSLFAAKALFILVFVNLPMLVADLVILPANGFRLSEHLAGLAWSQVLLTAVWVLPVAAMAAVTTGLLQVVLPLLGLALFTALFSSLSYSRVAPGWSAIDWIRTSFVMAVLASSALFVLFWQYRRRGTLVSRLLMVLMLVPIVLVTYWFPWRTAFHIQSRISKQIDTARVEITLDRGNRTRSALPYVPPRAVGVYLPIEISGLPNETETSADRVFAAIQARDGKPVDSGVNSLTHDAAGYWEWFLIDRSTFERVKNEPVTVRTSFYLTLFGDRKTTTVPPTNTFVAVPGAGLCSADSMFIRCLSPFRDPDHRISVRSGPSYSAMFSAQLTYSPFPADLGISPIEMVGQPAALIASDVVFLTEKPLAHFHRDVEFRDVRLADFAILGRVQ
jgi:hypothetical protein